MNWLLEDGCSESFVGMEPAAFTQRRCDQNLPGTHFAATLSVIRFKDALACSCLPIGLGCSR